VPPKHSSIGVISYLEEVREKNESQLLSWELAAFRDQEKKPNMEYVCFSFIFALNILFFMQIKVGCLA